MPLITIESPADPRLEIYRDLNKANLLRTSGRFIAEGLLVVERMLAAAYRADSLLAEEKHAERLQSLVPHETPIFCASRRLIKEIIGYQFHRGALACGVRRPFSSLQDVVPATGPATVVVCPQVQDPENMGSILRSACVLGASAVVLGKGCADPFSRRVLRVAMGNTFGLPLAELGDGPADLAKMRDEQGLTPVAAVLDEDAEPLESFSPPERCAVLFGEEGHGLPNEIVALCSRRITLRMARGADSLNVAVASGVFLYHILRRPNAAADE
jgi:tRNA G18 (ribose-2'-O)-methylase SpoU